MIRKRYLVAGAVLFAAASMGAGAAEAACKSGFCMSGYYSGKQRWVDFTTSKRSATHFNVFNGRDQIELGSNERSFRVYKVASHPTTYSYRIQWCVRGGVFSSSTCGAWVSFSHKDKE